MSGSYHLVILSKPLKDERIACKKLFEEHLYFSLPRQHPKARAKKLSFHDMDGAMMLVSGNTGFWHNIHIQKMPHTRFLMQDEYETFRELVHAPSLPSFVTDQTMRLEQLPADRVAIPIADDEASVSYYTACQRDNIACMNRLNDYADQASFSASARSSSTL
ncbi:MAG: hypothetical protein IJM56_03215 [Clostridia bacterium]|nr:hypothetical protein [Clostridia bacterium]